MTTKIKVEFNDGGNIQKLSVPPSSLFATSESFKNDLKEVEDYLLKKTPHFLSNRLYSRAMFEFLAAENEFYGEPPVKLGEVLCYCTGLTRSHFKRLIKDHPKKSLEDLRIETKATLMCRGCKKDFQQLWDDVLAENGAVSKLAEKLTRIKIDENGKRLTYKGQYPAYWIKVLIELQNEWQAREDFKELFQFEMTDAPVPFVDFILIGELEAHKAQIYFEHFQQYVEEKTNAKWYFTLNN